MITTCRHEGIPMIIDGESDSRCNQCRHEAYDAGYAAGAAVHASRAENYRRDLHAARQTVAVMVTLLRNEFRARKDYAEADRLRNDMRTMGYVMRGAEFVDALRGS